MSIPDHGGVISDVFTSSDAIARFYGVHFEYNNDGQRTSPMIVCGNDKKAGKVQVIFDRCVFFGNETVRPAIYFGGVDTCEVIATRFENFDNAELPVKVASHAVNMIIRDPIILPHNRNPDGLNHGPS